MKHKLSHGDAELLLADDDENNHRQILADRRSIKALKKNLSTRPEKKWVGDKKRINNKD